MPPLKGDPNQHTPSILGDTLIGTCLCGSICVTIRDPSLWTKCLGHLCHCANCRKVSGSYVTSNLNIKEATIHIDDLHRVLKMYIDLDTMSGREVGRYFCSNCEFSIKLMTVLSPGRVILKMGLSRGFCRLKWRLLLCIGIRRRGGMGVLCAVAG
ncbi:Mss4-like protein [Aspergillus oleicola]